MNQLERQAIMSLAYVPGRGRSGSLEDVLRLFNSSDPCSLGISLLEDAARRRDPIDLEMAFILCGVTGVKFEIEQLALLLELARSEWHKRHEEVVSALGQLASPLAIPALVEMVQWVPSYLESDENRALASRAIREIGKIPGSEAVHALQLIAESGSEILRTRSEHQLQRRKLA